MKIKKLIAPVIALAFAAAGAFATNIEKEESIPELGYIDAPNPCTISVQCDTEGDFICRAQNGQQAYGKVSPTQCTKVLMRLDPQ